MSHVAGNGTKKYWTSLADREGQSEIRDLQSREFQTPSETPTELPSRREFLKLLSAGAAFAAAGCARKPVEKVLPYLKAPEEVTPGNAVYYATTCGECPAACGAVVKTREGRPIKLEGNPDHPLTHGGFCARGQASVLNLYDPDRLKAPGIVDRATGAVRAATWGEVDKKTVRGLQQAAEQGKAIVLLTGTVNSPSTRALIDGFLASFPSAEHVVYDPVSSDALARGQELCYGERIIPGFAFEHTDLVVSLGADFLGSWLSPVEFARAFSRRRRPESGSMARLIAIESTMSLTGTNADQRVRARPEHLYPIAMALAHELLVREPRGPLAADAVVVNAVRSFGVDRIEVAAGMPQGTLTAIANQLWEARGRGLVLAGPQAAPAGQAVGLQVAVNLLNSALGNEGVTVDASTASQQARGSEEAVTRLVERMRGGDVGALLVHGVNPAYSLPGAVGYAEAVKRVSFVASFADRADETAMLADVVAPDTHFLESWNDHEPRRGVRSLTQPAIAPLYDVRPFQESLLAWARYVGKGPLAAVTATWHDWLRDRWRSEVYSAADAAAPFELFWEGALREGVIRTTVSSSGARSFRSGALTALPEWTAPAAGSLSLVLYAPVSLYDGRSANNAWMQEVPDPVTKVSWDNVILISPSRARDLGALGATENLLSSEVFTIDAGHASFDLPIHVQPGLHPDVVAIAVGYGRRAAGRVGNGVGQNAYALAQATGGRIGTAGVPVTLKTTGKRVPVAMSQGHQTADSRPILFETTFAEYQRDPRAGNESHGHLPSMWTRHKYPGHKWGMAIDLTACIGCSACMVACRSENNIPVVGKKVVLQGREMDWIRIDRYYSGDPENPETVHQPMLCQHCENAPCETVCPVLATTHSSEGLNVQTYNRCVGTRYCSNNCPYKVRRFNWWEYSDVKEKSLRLVLNPDVTVRSKGIMEKCTFCVQRIRDGKERAKALGVPVPDGDIQTACMQTCPTDAIVFGDMNDPNSRVAKLGKNERGFTVLEELNTLPSITYQTKVRNHEDASA
jgi:molybdopterin-containing oxidoreductase family iron-sulfur binding subunit